jgi:acetylcholinesterase
MTDYLVRFAANLDPNGNTGIEWPRYDAEKAPVLMTFLDGPVPLELTNDTYREEAMNAVMALTLTNPFT